MRFHNFVKNRVVLTDHWPGDWNAYQDALRPTGCLRLFSPAMAASLTGRLARTMARFAPPAYSLNLFRYAVFLDRDKLDKTFGVKPVYSFEYIFTH